MFQSTPVSSTRSRPSSSASRTTPTLKSRHFRDSENKIIENVVKYIENLKHKIRVTFASDSQPYHDILKKLDLTPHHRQVQVSIKVRTNAE